MTNRDFPLAPTPSPNQNDKGKGKKLPSGATSASAEKDYAKAEEIRNSLKNLKMKDLWDMKKSGKTIQQMNKTEDSLIREGDRKTKATGGVIKKDRFKK